MSNDDFNKLPENVQGFLTTMEELNPDALYPTGMAECIIGIGERCGQPALFVVSAEKCIQHYMAQGMERHEAEEYHDFNNAGAWLGENTPIFLAD